MPDVKPKADAKTKTTEHTSKKRLLQHERIIYSDCFKFDVAKYKRNMSWTEDPDYVDVEHVHFFHTFDSSGKAQELTTPSCSHFHMVEVIPGNNPDDLPQVICKSGPMKFQTKKVAGRFKKVMVPANNHGLDSHTHEVEWVKSSTPKVRTVSKEAAKVLVMLNKKPELPKDVTEN